MRLWSPRPLTKAMRVPSGDQTGPEHWPRVWNIRTPAFRHRRKPTKLPAADEGDAIPARETAGE